MTRPRVRVKYQSITALSSMANTISWYQFGGFGFVYFNGAYDTSEVQPYFQEACSFFSDNIDEDGTIMLIGHWNGNATTQSWISPYGGQLVTHDARSLLLQTAGCSEFGKRIIYFDGHGHMNEQVEVDNGYLMGAHGIMAMSPQNLSKPIAAEDGSMYVQSNPTTLHYCLEIFSDAIPDSTSTLDPSTINNKTYVEILACLKEKSSVEECTASLYEEWPYYGKSGPEVESNTEPGPPTKENTSSNGSYSAPFLFAAVASMGMLLLSFV